MHVALASCPATWAYVCRMMVVTVSCLHDIHKFRVANCHTGPLNSRSVNGVTQYGVINSVLDPTVAPCECRGSLPRMSAIPLPAICPWQLWEG